MTLHDRTLSLLRRLWGAPGAILVASVLGAAAHVEPAEMARLACGPLLIGLGG